MRPPERAWRPAPEAREREPWSAFLLRTSILLGTVVGGLLLFAGATRLLFTPRLEVVASVAPAAAVAAGETVAVGLEVRNVRWRDGAAYVVVVVDGGTPAETEVEGPVVEIPARDTRTVAAGLRLSPGEHVAAAVLYDAWRENVRVDARYGLSVRVGRSEVRLVRTDLPARLPRGETVACTVWATNAGEVDERAVPIVVFEPVGGGRARERDGRSVEIPLGAETRPVPLVFRTDDLDPGRYTAALLFLSPRGERLGKGIYRRPVEIH